MMDGFTTAGLAGILYAEDFGEPVPGPAELVPDPVLAIEPVLTQQDVEAACLRAVAAAEAAWADGAAERRTQALELLGAGVREMRAAAAARAEAAADGVARTMLGMVAALLPHLCRAHGDAEVRALLRRLLPVVAQSGGVVVRVHAGLVPVIEADLALMDDDLVETVQLRAANLREGDARLNWEDGGLVRDTAALQAAVTDCLSELGLIDTAATATAAPATTDTVTEPRSLAHAH